MICSGTRKMCCCRNQPVPAMETPELLSFIKFLLRRSICGTLLALLFHTSSMNRNRWVHLLSILRNEYVYITFTENQSILF